MKRNVFIRIGLVVLIALSITTLPAPAIAEKGGNRHVSIYRDIYGVPHIYAKDNFSLFYGYGYALATDRLFQMEMSKRTVIGTVAEVLGKDYIEFDKSVRSNYTPVSIQQQYEALPKSHKDIFDG